MKSIIVGTAGHIDHGKTAIVTALTGIDADRLEEEKRRGITIDLGFAHLELTGPGGERLRFGFVDVPGHERFVRNMLAGVGGIDLVLLVIAADEGIKPQTREHFDICRLLSIQRGITVLTKSDLVDPETLAVVQSEVQEFLSGSFLENSPIIAVSSLRAAGLDQLKQLLARAAAEIPARDSSAITRLPIDRVFTMKGFGTVVTGTLVAGTIRKEDELQLFPSAKPVRVRGVQVHGITAEQAVAGERTALNLAGVDKQELERGMTLASTGTLHTSSRLDVKLSLLPSAKPLKNQSRVHFHAFTSEAVATVALYGIKQIEPGAEAFARLRLDTPVLLLPGDRFVIRQFSPVLTIGGGVVLDNTPLPKMALAERLEFLRIQAAGDDFESKLLSRIRRRRDQGTSLAQLIAETGRTADRIDTPLSYLLQRGLIVRHGDLLIDRAVLDHVRGRLQSIVSDFHRQNPLVAGIPRESLRGQAKLLTPIFEAALAAQETGRDTAPSRANMGATGPNGTTVSRALPNSPGNPRGGNFNHETRLEITGDLVHLPGRGVVMKDEELESRKLIEHAFASAALKVPALKDVLAGLKIDKTRAQKIVTLLLREKVLIKLSDDLVFHRDALSTLRQNLATRKLRSPRIDVAGFKEMTGVSRKYAIPLLEYLDRERVTKRVGDERVIL
jgi:selenocysteine-specific elongation factor